MTASAAKVSEMRPQSDLLISRTFAIRVRFNRLGNTRRVMESQYEVEADKSLIHISKRLIATDAFSALTRIQGEVVRYIDRICLPYLEVGVRLIPFALLGEVNKYLTKKKAEWDEAVEKFVKGYPKYCQDAAKGLDKLYSAADYPPASYVRKQFDFYWQIMTFGEVPENLRELDPQIYEDEARKMRSTLREAAEEITAFRREAFAKLVEHLAEQLTPDKDGETKRLPESTVQKLKDFLYLDDAQNVTNDVRLKELADQAKKLMEGVSAEALRNTDSVRERVSKGMNQILKQVDKLVKTEKAPVRKFKYDED